MGEFLVSILKRIQNRATTTLFAVYGGFWAALHAEGIIALLFTDQDYIFDKFGMLKNEYLFRYFFGIASNPIDFTVRQGLAILLTYLYVKFFARLVLNPIYKTEIKYKYDRKIEKAKQERRLRDEKVKLAKVKSAQAEEEAKAAKAKLEIEKSNPEVIWRKEYDELISNGGRNVIESLIRVYYDYSGRIKDSYGQYNVRKEDVLACEALSLFERNSNNSSTIRLTAKGWFFVKKLKNLA